MATGGAFLITNSMDSLKRFAIIEGPTISSVIKEANSYGITKEEYVDIVVTRNNVVLIYYS